MSLWEGVDQFCPPARDLPASLRSCCKASQSAGGGMRSELVFDAVRVVSNRFLLTKAASKATRKLHRRNARMQDTINDVLAYVSGRNRNEVAPLLSKATTPNHLTLQATRGASDELTSVYVASIGRSLIALRPDKGRRTALAPAKRVCDATVSTAPCESLCSR
jgi:hypothetical protein